VNHVLEAVNVCKTIGDQAVLRDISLAIPAGSIHGIVGSNGAGKTTLLRMFNGVYRPTSGTVRAFGDVLPPDAAHIRQRVHYVSADGAFYPGFHVADLLRYASLLYQGWDASRCDALVKVLELPLHRPIRKLSLGMKMQLRLAVALSSRPDVLMLDEPTNGLDPVVRRQFLQLIVQEAAGSGMTVVMATHRLEDLEAIADGISVLYKGRLVLSGTLETFKHQFSEVIAVTESNELPDVTDAADIVSVQSRGKIHTWVVQGDTRGLADRLRQAGVSHMDIQPITFEDAFRALMEKEGYSRDAILLS
jgi:ABC-2 type transport system ATP-binding protein